MRTNMLQVDFTRAYNAVRHTAIFRTTLKIGVLRPSPSTYARGAQGVDDRRPRKMAWRKQALASHTAAAPLVFRWARPSTTVS